MTESKPVETLLLPNAAAWCDWLTRNESMSDGVWLVLAKKGRNAPTTLSYAQALEEALCSGWVDGQAKRIDEATFRQRFTPRRQYSLWSMRNVDRAERLFDQGRMRQRGIDEIERAKNDGRWQAAYAGASDMQMPQDLEEALDRVPAARRVFETLNSTNRYAVLFRVSTARTVETRQRRIDRLVAMLEHGETPHPQ